MHLGKSKVMFNDHVNKSTITVDGKIIEEVDSYVYLGKTLTLDGDLLPEIRKRIALSWAAFGKVDNIMRSRKASMKIKRKIHDEYILPVMTYGCETWALNNAMTEKLAFRTAKDGTHNAGYYPSRPKAKHLDSTRNWCKRHRQCYQDCKA